MKNLPLEAKLFHAGGRADGRMDVRTDMTKLTVAVRNFVNSPKIECVLNKNIPGFSNEKEKP
jgi:hypothetical protein